jgi:hypothetical protein
MLSLLQDPGHHQIALKKKKKKGNFLEKVSPSRQYSGVVLEALMQLVSTLNEHC